MGDEEVKRFPIAKNSWGTGWAPYGGYFAVAYDSNCDFGTESTYYSGFEVYDPA